MVCANIPLRRDAPSRSQGVEDRQGVGHAIIASNNGAGTEWVVDLVDVPLDRELAEEVVATPSLHRASGH
eukprot:2610330-Lingulodinium_polyedra.AAC.1